jgi:Prealbumin-like fold domain
VSPRQKVAAITSAAVVVVATAAVIVAAVFVASPGQNGTTTSFATNSSTGTLTIITVSGGSPIGGSTYVITPNLFDSSAANYTIQDGGSGDRNGAAGVVTMSGLQDGRYVVTQLEAPSGYQRDRLSKIVEIVNQGDDVATFNSISGSEGEQQQQQQQQQQNGSTPIRNLTYTVKFECGTISGSEGPLRPGHYHTDIGILNKQEFPVKVMWSATPNDGSNTNSILRTLQPQGSTSIVCNDVRKVLGNDQRFVEGFVIINVPLEPGLLGTLSEGTVILGRTIEDINMLEVQAFYTANALAELPHQSYVDKITFAIVNDTSGKIPVPMIGKTLDITVSSEINQVSDPEMKVKSALAETYGLSEQELQALEVDIRDVSVGVGTMIDDHAISLSTVLPQASG